MSSFRPCLSAVSWAVDRMWFQGTLGSGCTWSVVYWGIQLDIFLISCSSFSALFVCYLMSCRSYVIPWNFGLRLYVICCQLRYTAGHLLDWLWLLFGLVCLLSHELSIVCDSMELWAQAVLDLLSMQLDVFLIGCGFFSALFVCRLMSCQSYVIPWNFWFRLYVICCLLRYTAGHLLDWLWLLFGLVCLLSHELSIVCDSKELRAQAVRDLLSTEVYSWTSSWLAVAPFRPCLSAISRAVDRIADRCRPGVGIDHTSYSLHSDFISWSLCCTWNRWIWVGSGRWQVSQNYSLLNGAEDAVYLNSAWSLLPADCSNCRIVCLVSNVLSVCGSGLCIRDAL